jgi:hypothetical protein
MARVRPIGPSGESSATGSAVGLRRRALLSLASVALALGGLASGPLRADDPTASGWIALEPGSFARDASSAPSLIAPVTLRALETPLGALLAGSDPNLVAIDGSPAAPRPASILATSTIGAANCESSIWTAFGQSAASCACPARPPVVLTAAEEPYFAPDDQAPWLPQHPFIVAGEQRPPEGSAAGPAGSDSEFQPLEGCACSPISVYDDAWAFLPRVGHDLWGMVNWDDAIVLGVGLAGALALRGDVDQDVRNWTAEHPDRWGHATNLLGDFGTVQYQLPVIFGAYALTVWQQDQWGHDMMSSLISAYTLFGVSTLVIKVSADTKRPSDGWNGGSYGFPSWHDGSLFCMSAVIDEYEGHWIGVPLYILSGLVGWSRIDARDHDLSDVVFGGILGYVIGKSVAGRALYGDSRVVHIVPYFHPSDGSAGVMLDAKF